MTKDEALKLALEASEEAKLHIWLGDKKGVAANIKCHQTITAIEKCLANDALEKKAENARELGLDYEPAKPEALRLADAMEYDLDWCDEAAAELRRMHDLLGKANALCRIRAEEIERLKAQPEQKPVAWKLVPVEPTKEMLKAMDECSTEGYDERLYAGHAASVYMAAVDVAPTPPQRPSRSDIKPLTDDEIILIVAECASSHQHTDIHFARAIERAHGIKELV